MSSKHYFQRQRSRKYDVEDCQKREATQDCCDDCPKDKGYAWVVALSCFFSNFLLGGIARSMGLMYVGLVEDIGATRFQAALPFGIRTSVRNLTGPLIGFLGLRYGIRKVTTVGALVAALGSILCYFGSNILLITIFWGVIHGIGFGLSTVIHMMIISQYFDKYRASALGLGYSGDCFGTFVFPSIMEHLLANYGVRGTFLILGGVILNVVPMALLLRKPPWMRNKKKSVTFSDNIKQHSDIEVITQKHSEADDLKHRNKNFRPSVGCQNDAFSKREDDLSPSNDDEEDHRHRNKVTFQVDENPPVDGDMTISNRRIDILKSEIESLSGSFRSHRKPSDLSEIIRVNATRHDSLPPVFENKVQVDDNDAISSISEDTQSSDNDPSTDGRRVGYMRRPRKPSFLGQMTHDIVHRMRTASFVSQVAQDGFMCNLQETDSEERTSSISHEDRSSLKNTDKASLDDPPEAHNNDGSKELVLSVNDINNLPGEKSGHFSAQLAETGKQSVFQTLVQTNSKPIFILISVSMAVYAFLFVGILTIIVDYAIDQGVDHDHGKYLLIGFSVTDLFGRLSFGLIIDLKLIKIKNYSGITMLLMGTLVAAIPLNRSFKYMMACMCMYGFVQGGTAIMFPILVNHYMNRNEESVAMGCLNFYGGLLMLTLAPMIGYFRDNNGSYNWVFHILGGLVLVVGIIWQTEPLILKFQRRQLLKRAALVSEH